jgi:hypothetical protein
MIVALRQIRFAMNLEFHMAVAKNEGMDHLIPPSPENYQLSRVVR